MTQRERLVILASELDRAKAGDDTSVEFLRQFIERFARRAPASQLIETVETIHDSWRRQLDDELRSN